MNANDKRNLKEVTVINSETDTFSLEDLEAQLDEQLEEELKDLELSAQERESIGNPDQLGKVIMDATWEQFINQIAVTAGTDFIKENGELKLDLRNDAHIQTAENFKNGKIAKHNHISREQLEKNQERYQNTSHKEFRQQSVNPGMDATLERAGTLNKKGNATVKDIYTGRQISTETKLANGKNNPKAAQREHVTPSAEIYKDPTLQMGKSDQQLADTINDPNNLQGYTTAERNIRKSDKSVDEMSTQDKTKHHEQADKKSKDFLEKEKQKETDRLRKEGRQTQKEETLRIGGKALRTAVMQLLAELMREIVAKLIKWFKSAKRTIETLTDGLKEAIHSFISNLKAHIINAGKGVLSTILTAIIGPVFDGIKKIWMILKRGWNSLKEAIRYLKDPANKGKPVELLLAEVGKIVVASLTAMSAISLGKTIETGLLTLPAFAAPIPLIGSLGSIIGIFFGAIVSGVVGAIALNQIDKLIAKKKKYATDKKIADQTNKILALQAKQHIVSEAQLENKKESTVSSISERHEEANQIMQDSLTNIMDDFVKDPFSQQDKKTVDEKDLKDKRKMDEMDDELRKLLDSF